MGDLDSTVEAFDGLFADGVDPGDSACLLRLDVKSLFHRCGAELEGHAEFSRLLEGDVSLGDGVARFSAAHRQRARADLEGLGERAPAVLLRGTGEQDLFSIA